MIIIRLSLKIPTKVKKITKRNCLTGLIVFEDFATLDGHFFCSDRRFKFVEYLFLWLCSLSSFIVIRLATFFPGLLYKLLRTFVILSNLYTDIRNIFYFLVLK